MGETLTLASQKGAYTLTDEGTYLAFKSNLALAPLVTEGTTLLNRYSVIAVNPAKNANVNIVEADRFTNWLISDEGKEFVKAYGVDKYGKSLFTPLTENVCGGAPFNCACTGDVSPA
ncbi:MAG: tungsten ABC transporter substrate-binding protein, partial [Methanomicrobiales archaeon]|nr:tungsten ABC transporter substrate-binding protein [Methanomicrobiales archaeon]